MSVECVATAKDVLHRPVPAVRVNDECERLRSVLDRAILRMDPTKKCISLLHTPCVSNYADELRLYMEFLDRGFRFTLRPQTVFRYIWIANDREKLLEPKYAAKELAREEWYNVALGNGPTSVIRFITLLSKVMFGCCYVFYIVSMLPGCAQLAPDIILFVMSFTTIIIVFMSFITWVVPYLHMVGGELPSRRDEK